MEESHTEQYVEQGQTIKLNGVVLECTFVSYQERPKAGGEPGDVERYNFTYSFRPKDDMDRERAETTPPSETDTASETNPENEA